MPYISQARDELEISGEIFQDSTGWFLGTTVKSENFFLKITSASPCILAATQNKKHCPSDLIKVNTAGQLE